MKTHTHKLPRATPLALAVTSSALLAGCLGGSSEDPFKIDPSTPAVTAASCFDNALNYTVGNTITMDYTNFDATSTELQASSAKIQVVRNTASFEGQNNLLLINSLRGSIVLDAENSWLTELDTYGVRTIPSTGIFTTVGTVAKTTRNNSSAAEETITTVYNPAITDQRRTLEVGKMLSQTLSGTETRTTPTATNQPVGVPFNYKRDITFIGKENLQIGTQRVEACRFKTTTAGQADITEWVYRGQTIRKESNGRLVEQVTGFATTS